VIGPAHTRVPIELSQGAGQVRSFPDTNAGAF